MPAWEKAVVDLAPEQSPCVLWYPREERERLAREGHSRVSEAYILGPGGRRLDPADPEDVPWVHACLRRLLGRSWEEWA
jgi:hypothetical protein